MFHPQHKCAPQAVHYNLWTLESFNELNEIEQTLYKNVNQITYQFKRPANTRY